MGSIQPEVIVRTGHVHAAEPPKPKLISVHNGTLDNGASTEAKAGFIIVEGVKHSPTLVVTSGSDKELTLVGAGVRGIRLPHGVELKVTVLAIYVDEEVVKHLRKYGGHSAEKLLADDQFLRSFLQVPVDISARVTFLLPLTGEDYAGKSGENTEKDLKALNLWGEGEELALQEYRKFFKTVNCPPGSSVYFTITKSGLEIAQSFDSSFPKEAEFVVKNRAFGEALVGTMLSISGVSPQLRIMFGKKMASLLEHEATTKVLKNGTVTA